MRIPDSLRYRLFQLGLNDIGRQMDDITKKLSTQRIINVPSDDPVGYATSIQYDAQLSQGTQYNTNLQRLSTLVSMYTVSFSSVVGQLSDVSQMANTYGTMDPSMRQAAAEQMKSIIEQMVTVGNSRLGDTYIFGGKQADKPPLQLNGDYSVTFNPDQRGEDATKIYVDSGQTSQYGVSGREAFYGNSKIAFASVTNKYTGDIYSNTDSFAYVIDTSNDGMLLNGQAVSLTQGVYNGFSLSADIEDQLNKQYVVNSSNNQIYVNGSAVTLASGTYTGANLAAQIKTQLGADYAVAYESSGTRTFSITNNTGAAATFNWSDSRSTAGKLLGFDNVDSVVSNLGIDTSDHSAEKLISVAFDSTTRKFVFKNNTGGDVVFNAGAEAAGTLGFDNIYDITVKPSETIKSDIDTGRKAFQVKITNNRSAAGGPTYQFSVDGGSTWSANVSLTSGGADTTADITITAGTNDVIYRNGAAITLAAGAYTGAGLAQEIQNKLNVAQAGHIVTYDALTRKIDIANNTGSAETFNWSNAGATAAGVLGFDNVESVVSNGTSDVGDYDTGMFIDGKGVANTTNNRIKALFSSSATDNLTVGDTFHVKDLSVFELLKNVKDAFESGNDTWVAKNIKYIDAATELTAKNTSVIVFQVSSAKNMIANNKTKEGSIQMLQADLVNADTAKLATEFNTLITTYQALLATLARMQSITILNYLN